MYQLYTNQFTEFLKENKPFIYTKFGDGEFNAMKGFNGSNCDGENYSSILKTELIKSLQYLSNQENSFIGAWHTQEVIDYISSITSTKINWVNYHTIIMDQYNIKNKDLFNLFKAIKESKKEKLYICNHLLNKAKILLNVDKCINIPLHGWFEYHFERIKNEVISNIKTNDPLILVSSGMGGKVLISQLHQLYPKATFIDIGSCLDFILTKKDSRGNSIYYSYDDLLNYYRDILPPDWEDEKYNILYEEAKIDLGRHL